MKTLQVVADGAPGGGTTHVLQVLHAFRDAHDQTLVTQRDSYLVEEARRLGHRVLEVDFQRSRFSREAGRTMSTIIDEHQPDLLHCHGGRAAYFCRFARQAQPFFVYTVHGFHYPRRKWPLRTMLRWTERRNLAAADAIIFVASFDQQLAERDRLLTPGDPRAVVIHNGVPCPEIEPKPVHKRLVFLARYVLQKHPELFLEMMSQLPEYTAVMAGGGPLADALHQRIEQLKLNDRVELRDSLSRQQALELLASGDALVMTSRWEGLPLTCLEAMWLGVPVVATPVGELPLVMEHDRSGLLSKSETADELASLVRKVIDDRSCHERIAAAARERVEQHFSEEAMMARLQDVYEQAKVAA
jgi:glycosyltransferase involved in cell wall biosynthesis